MTNKILLNSFIVAVFGAVAYFTSSSPIEILSAISGLLCVWLAAKRNVWTYPVGLVNIVCYMYMFYNVQLYADAGLQIVFFVLSLYGWFIWLTKREGQPVRPTRVMTTREWVLLLPVILAITIVWGGSLHNFTNASIPYLDAFVASMSVVAQFFMGKKVLENWLLWIAIDVLSIGMYMYKDLHIVALTYVFFLANAVYGYIAWKKEYEAENGL